MQWGGRELHVPHHRWTPKQQHNRGCEVRCPDLRTPRPSWSSMAVFRCGRFGSAVMTAASHDNFRERSRSNCYMSCCCCQGQKRATPRISEIHECITLYSLALTMADNALNRFNAQTSPDTRDVHPALPLSQQYQAAARIHGGEIHHRGSTQQSHQAVVTVKFCYRLCRTA